MPSEGIPALLDLTHIQDLLISGRYLLSALMLAFVLAAVYGAVLALLGRTERLPATDFGHWARQYGQGLQLIRHGALVGLLLAVSFAIGSTLANRTHHWEQARVTQSAETVSGGRIDQQTPSLRYFTDELRRETRYVNGQPTDVEVKTAVSHSLNLAASDLRVTIAQAKAEDERLAYRVDFQGDYTVSNPLPEAHTFFFDAYLPTDYSLLRDFRVERDGRALSSDHVSERSFKFRLGAGESARFSVRYQAEGPPRWVYTANQSLLSNFRLRLETGFPGAEFAGGVAPTRTEAAKGGQAFIWEFKDNVSVQNPFGVFTAARTQVHTGVLPRLLLLAPILLLLWLAMLYLCLPLQPVQVIASGGLFLALLLALTYLSRSIEPVIAWLLLSLFAAAMVWLQHPSQRPAALLSTVTGLLLPVLALLLPTAGLGLSLAALLAMLWLSLRLQGTWRQAERVPDA